MSPEPVPAPLILGDSALTLTLPQDNAPANGDRPGEVLPWLWGMAGLVSLFLIVIIWTRWRLSLLQRQWQQERIDHQKTQQAYAEVLQALQQWEQNPDLTSACHCTLAYLRIRMDEEIFHYTVMHQIRRHLTTLLHQALHQQTFGDRLHQQPIQETQAIYGDVVTPQGQWQKGLLFRLQVNLSQLPLQSSRHTVDQIMVILENFLTDTHQPPFWDEASDLGLSLGWDEQSQPIPLLVMRQTAPPRALFQHYALPELAPLPEDLSPDLNPGPLSLFE